MFVRFAIIMQVISNFKKDTSTLHMLRDTYAKFHPFWATKNTKNRMSKLKKLPKSGSSRRLILKV